MTYPPNPYGTPPGPYGQPGQPGQFGPPPGSQTSAGYPPFGSPQGYPQQPPQGPPPGGFGPPPGYSQQPQPNYGGPQPQRQQFEQQPPVPVPPSPVPEPAKREPTFVKHDLPVATVDFIAGRDITATLGEVMGVVTRPRDMRNAPDQAIVILEARQDAVARMVDLAVEAGADAVIGLRFDGGKISEGASEVTAYGTAVTLAGGDSERTDVAVELEPEASVVESVVLDDGHPA